MGNQYGPPQLSKDFPIGGRRTNHWGGRGFSWARQDGQIGAIACNRVCLNSMASIDIAGPFVMEGEGEDLHLRSIFEGQLEVTNGGSPEKKRCGGQRGQLLGGTATLTPVPLPSGDPSPRSLPNPNGEREGTGDRGPGWEREGQGEGLGRQRSEFSISGQKTVCGNSRPSRSTFLTALTLKRSVL